MKKEMSLTILAFAAAAAAFAQNIADFQYTASNGAATITGYTGSAERVSIPAQIGNLPVAAIGDGAFMHNRLTSVTIPNPVAAIGEYAFYGNQLTGVTIPNSVASLGKSAFEGNQLTDVTIGNSVAAIEDGAFRDNQLTSVTIPNSVAAIGDGAFSGNQLTSVTIGDNVDIQALSFYALLYTHYQANNRKAAVYTFSRSQSNDGDFETLVCNNSVEIARYRGGKTDVKIPETINNLPVIAIGYEAFMSKRLTGVTIPNSVAAIGEYAFFGNQLTSVTIPNSIAAIGRGAFGRNRLTGVTLPDSVTSIGALAFQGNQLTSVTIPNSVASIGAQAFSYNQLTSVTIPDSVASIGDWAFNSREQVNQLTSVTIGANIDVSDYSFPGNFTDVYINGGKQAGTYRSSDRGATWRKQ